MSKVVKLEDIKKLFKNGMTIMSGGFMACGAPQKLIDFLIEQDIKDINLISTDTATPSTGTGKLVVNGNIKSLVASYIGSNPETGKKMISGEIEVNLCPQGTLAERIRAGGAGLGGVLTPTGIGTEVAKGKQTVVVNGKEYLLETPLRADIALIKGSVVDTAGNVVYHGTTSNFNTVMAMAADIVIAEAETVVEKGDIAPESIHTQGVLVDYVIDGGGQYAS